MAFMIHILNDEYEKIDNKFLCQKLNDCGGILRSPINAEINIIKD